MADSHDTGTAPRVSVIIPTRDGYRGGAVPRLLDSIRAQDFHDYELHLIKGIPSQGKAINMGVEQARGDTLVILDDDSRLADATVFRRLVETLDQDASIGMAGASIVVAPEASSFQRRAAQQFPRFNMPVMEEITDSDLPCHGCCAIPTHVFQAIGGEREDIVRGLDPDLRVRLREKGYRVVLVPHARIHHPMPDGWLRLVRIFFRNGMGSAYSRKFHPETVYETAETPGIEGFQKRTTFCRRLLRYPVRLATALIHGRLQRFVAYCSYALGYAWASLTAHKHTP